MIEDIFLGLDTEEDLKLLRKIYENLGSKNEYFNAYDIVNFLTQNTDIKKINEEIKRNIKFKSLLKYIFNIIMKKLAINGGTSEDTLFPWSLYNWRRRKKCNL